MENGLGAVTDSLTAIQAALAQAALCESFDAVALAAAITDPGQRRVVLQQLARDCIEIERDGRFRWTMLQPARERTLAELKPEEFERALAAHPDDPLARQFASILRRARSTSGYAPLLYRALELLRLAQGESVPVSARDLEARARLTRANLDRQSATEALQGTLRGPLRGRAAPLRFLRAFASGGARAIEAQHRDPAGAELLRASLSPRRWQDVSALLVSGIGGIGKSALIAELIRKERGPRWKRRIVVHFDFDEPALRAGEQAAMLLEFARQLALARPDLDEAMSLSRSRLRAGMLAIERLPTGVYEQTRFLLQVELSHWRPLLVEHGIDEVLLVLDTIEEVTTIDFRRLDALFDWLDALRQDAGLRRLHVIGSGRALVSEDEREQLWPYFLAELALGNLPARAARAMLRDRLHHESRYEHVELARRCVEVFGGNPLVLSILARYCVDNNVAELEALLADAQSDDGRRRFGLAAQQFLYGRILERVRDETIRPLVYPGLVLRRVTPVMLCEVLAGSCGMGTLDIGQAEMLLGKLQRLAWLVTRDGDGVRHRRDVRRQMLPLILERESERAAAVSRAAAQWLGSHGKPELRDAATLESWYHRGLLGEAASEDEADLRLLSLHLGEDIDDLPLSVRALVKAAGGRSLTPAEQEALPERLLNAAVEQQSRRLREEGLDSVALSKTTTLPVRTREEARERRDNRSNAEVVRTLFANGQFEEAADHLPDLLVEFATRVQSSDPVQALADDPAYLAAVAARAFRPRPFDWTAAIRALPDKVTHDDLPRVLALETVLWPSSTGASMSDSLDKSGDLARRVSFAPLRDWKLLLASVRSQRSGDHLTNLFTLPFLHPALVELLHDCAVATASGADFSFDDVNFAWSRKEKSGWRRVLRVRGYSSSRDLVYQLLEDTSEFSFSKINQMLDLAKTIQVEFDIESARGSGFSPLGLVPEFYAPIRSAFRAELQPSEIARLVELVMAPVRTWPTELAPRQFAQASAGRSNALIPVLLTLADYHGGLGTLVRTAAEARPGANRIGRVKKLFDAFESAWAL